MFTTRTVIVEMHVTNANVEEVFPPPYPCSKENLLVAFYPAKNGPQFNTYFLEKCTLNVAVIH